MAWPQPKEVQPQISQRGVAATKEVHPQISQIYTDFCESESVEIGEICGQNPRKKTRFRRIVVQIYTDFGESSLAVDNDKAWEVAAEIIRGLNPGSGLPARLELEIHPEVQFQRVNDALNAVSRAVDVHARRSGQRGRGPVGPVHILLLPSAFRL